MIKNNIQNVENNSFSKHLTEKLKKNLITNTNQLVILKQKHIDFLYNLLLKPENNNINIIEEKENQIKESISTKHTIILRRILLEDQEYPDYLLNLLEIQLMKDFENYKLNNLKPLDDQKNFEDKTQLTILAYYYKRYKNNIYSLEILYLNKDIDENYFSFEKLNKTIISDKEIFENLSQKIRNLKKNFFYLNETWYGILDLLKIDTNISYKFENNEKFTEKNLRVIFLKPLLFLKQIIDKKELEKKEKIWYLVFLGKRYHQLKENRQCIKLLDESYMLRVEEWGENHIETSDSLNRIGCALLRRRNSENAHEFFQKALNLRRKIYGYDNVLTAICLYNLGIFYYNANYYKEALDYFFECIEIYIKIENDVSIKLAEVYHATGTAFFKLFEFRNAILFLNKAIQIFNNLYGEFNIRCATIYCILSLLKEKTNEIPYGYIYLLKSYKIYSIISGERSKFKNIQKECVKFKKDKKSLLIIDIAFNLKKEIKVFRRKQILCDIMLFFF